MPNCCQYVPVISYTQWMLFIPFKKRSLTISGLLFFTQSFGQFGLDCGG
jgi:hypothetical protein